VTTTSSDKRSKEIVLAPNGEPVARRKVLYWEVAAFFIINLVAGVLHFAFELSNFSEPLAVVASVNESTFEHLKLYFWPAFLLALVQHAYVKGTVNNYWYGKGLALLATPVTLIVAFYAYLGVVIPIYGKGILVWTLIIGASSVLVGNYVAYRILTSAEKGKTYRNVGLAIGGVLTILMATSAWFPPEFFLYENFFGYVYTGEYGILDDYTPYLVFQGR